MKCPVCEKILIPGKKERYETLCDHVSDPNKEDYPERNTYVCPNEYCIFYENAFWDDMGDLYTKRSLDYRIMSVLRQFNKKNENMSALNSFAYKNSIEGYYSNNRQDIYIGKKWRLAWYWNVTADDNGNILKKQFRFQIFRRDKKMDGWIYHTLGINMFLHIISAFKYSYKLYKKDPNSRYAQEDLYEKFHHSENWPDREWWRKAAQQYLRIRYWRIYKDILKEKKIPFNPVWKEK